MSKAEELKKIVNRIDNIVIEIRKKKITEINEMEDYFWNNHEDIMNNYPFLVSQICMGGDRKMLDYMINTISKIENGNMEQSEADVDIGQKIVDDYIKPQLEKNKK